MSGPANDPSKTIERNFKVIFRDCLGYHWFYPDAELAQITS
jgi:hypothetical protein